MEDRTERLVVIHRDGMVPLRCLRSVYMISIDMWASGYV